MNERMVPLALRNSVSEPSLTTSSPSRGAISAEFDLSAYVPKKEAPAPSIASVALDKLARVREYQASLPEHLRKRKTHFAC